MVFKKGLSSLAWCMKVGVFYLSPKPSVPTIWHFIRFLCVVVTQEVRIGEDLEDSGENVFVGGENRWKYVLHHNVKHFMTCMWAWEKHGQPVWEISLCWCRDDACLSRHSSAIVMWSIWTFRNYPGNCSLEPLKNRNRPLWPKSFDVKIPVDYRMSRKVDRLHRLF